MIQDKSQLLNAFKAEFASSVNNVLINSTGERVNFREVSVFEQKSLSKMMIQNENRKDIVYDAQCALINKLALNEGFDVYALTEFDRIKILMEVYQSNFFKNKTEFKCKECGCQNQYELDFSKAVENMDKIKLEELEYEYSDKVRSFKFRFAYPLVKTVSGFYKFYAGKYRNVNQKERQVLDNMGNIEYINLFIKSVEVSHIGSEADPLKADFASMKYADIEELLAMFPQDIFYNENGIINFVTKNYLEKLNGAFEKPTCQHCGAVYDESVGGVGDFL